MTAHHATFGIIGAGAIGLSIAYQLAKTRDTARESIVVLDAQLPGAASWAGAGILPPPVQTPTTDPLETLQRLSLQALPEWSAELLERTGIDNQYQRCGGFYLAMSAGEQAALAGLQSFWQMAGIETQVVTAEQWQHDQPWLAQHASLQTCRRIVAVPGEAQLRNPRHLQALRLACTQLGVHFVALESAAAPRLALEPTTHAVSWGSEESWRCDRWLLAAGSWTSQLLQRWVPDLRGVGSVFPVKGEMLLFKLPTRPFQSIINVGTRYFVPRQDGHVLVGSTEQEVGFDGTTSPAARDDLLAFTRQTLPGLLDWPLVQQWAGLRPASFDHTPLMGVIPGHPNLWVASGHFRSGLQWSVGTALCLAALLRDQPPPLDLRVFQPRR